MHLFVQIHPADNIQWTESFEGLSAALANLPGMYFEMDGSFVWVDHRASPPNQMDGMVYDRAGRLEYVEVKGACGIDQWLTLCQAISGIDEPNYAAIDSRVRIHRVADGDWTTATDIAKQLG